MKTAPSLADAIDVGRFADHQSAVVDTRLHPADVVSHDEQDIGLLLGGCHPGQQWYGCQNGHNCAHPEHCYDCSRLHTLSPLFDPYYEGPYDIARPSSLQAGGRYPVLLHPHEHHLKALLEGGLVIDAFELITRRVVPQRIGGAGIVYVAQFKKDLGGGTLL